jgi:hypothetical protein
VVNQKGRAADITVLSPLGFGLDEEAQAAVSKWEFVPGRKDDKPVNILATVEVNFRFHGVSFDSRTERRRTSFNLAIQSLSRGEATPAAIDRAVKTMLELCGQKFPPAMHAVGIWKVNGERIPKDPAEGLDLIQKAAAKHYAPAIFELAVRRFEGRDLPPDKARGLEEMRTAATLGSRQAQLYLGSLYEKGDGVPPEPDRARRNYRLCAAQGVAACQYRLGRLLYDAPDRKERDYLQAVALFQLAADQGLADAKTAASSETGKLTDEQTTWVARLKRQIVQRP